MLAILWIYRRGFLVIAATILAIAIAVIFTTPKNYIIKSAVDLGSISVGGKLEPLEPSDAAVKRVMDIYLPEVLFSMSKKGVPESDLTRVQNLKAEAVGHVVTIQGTTPVAFQDVYRQILAGIVDRLIQDQSTLVRFIRIGFDVRIDVARHKIDRYSENIKSIEAEISEINNLDGEYEKQGQLLNSQLSQISQRISSKGVDEAVITEAKLRDINEQLRQLSEFRNILSVRRLGSTQTLFQERHVLDEPLKTIADVEIERAAFRPAEISLSPTILPLATGPRRIFLLASSLIGSILIAFWIVIAFHRLTRSEKRHSLTDE